MADQELRQALDEVVQQLRDLGGRNEQLAQRNDLLVQQTQAGAVDMAEARRRIQQLEIAHQAGGGVLNGGGGALNAHGDGPDGPPRHPQNPRMPNLQFSGQENDDWMSFRGAFCNVARFSNYSNQQAKWALMGCMRGPAFLSVQDLQHDDNATMEQLLDGYEAKFLPAAASDIARARFETAVQGPKEVILQWHGRLQMLYTRAYGNPDPVTRAAQLCRAFARGLRHRRVREHVLRSQPADYAAALNFAQTEQAVLDSGTYIPGSVPAFATNIAGQHHGGARSRDTSEPMEIGAMGTGKIQCHTCHLFGHMSRDCELMKKLPPGAGAGGAPGGNRFRGRPPAGRGAPAKAGAAKTGWTPRPKTEGDPKARHRRFITAIADVIQDYDDYSEEVEEPKPEGEEPEPEEEGEADSPDDAQDFCA